MKRVDECIAANSIRAELALEYQLGSSFNGIIL